MKNVSFFPFKKIITVDDAPTIRALGVDENLDRQFRLHRFLNYFKIKRILKNLSYKDARFPHMLPKYHESRMQRHTELWNLFNTKAVAIKDGSEELELVAKWVRDKNSNAEPGIFAQQLIGQFFDPHFQAT